MHRKFMIQVVLAVGVYATAMPCYCEITQISPEKLNSMISAKSEKFTIVDVRSGYDFQKSHIAGAVNVPYNTVDKAGLTKEGTLVFYCTGEKCPLSRLAAKTLETAGYKNTAVLEGGIAGWTAKGFTVETPVGTEQRTTAAAVPAISPAMLRERLADKTIGIIDVRSAKEFKIAHLPGARNIPAGGLAAGVNSLSGNTEWVIYGRQAADINSAAQVLAAKNLKVMELSGGIQVWAAKKYPMESGEAK